MHLWQITVMADKSMILVEGSNDLNHILIGFYLED